MNQLKEAVRDAESALFPCQQAFITSTRYFPQAMPFGETVAERRSKVLLGELPNDFLRIAVEVNPQPGPEGAYLPQPSFIPPNTRGRISVSIIQAQLVKSYTIVGLVRMDPYCRLRVGNAVFQTQTHLNGGRSPVWNRTLHAYLPQGVESIYVQVFDEKAFTSDECIAWQHVILPPAIFDGDTVDDYFPLNGQMGQEKEGMIHLVLSFAPIEGIPQQAVVPVVQEQLIQDEDVKAVQEMFPDIDKEVIMAVLQQCHGNKDAAVSSLLELA